MNGANIHVTPNDLRDWVVKEEGTGREFGHYPTQADAEAVGLALARKRKSTLVLQDGGGQQRRVLRQRPHCRPARRRRDPVGRTLAGGCALSMPDRQPTARSAGDQENSYNTGHQTTGIGREPGEHGSRAE